MSRVDHPGEDLSEQELMQLVVRGEVEAFEQIVRRFWSGTLAYIRHLTHDADRAEDIAQEVFSRLWRRRHDWSDTGSVRIWLFRAARNLVISERRHWMIRARRALDLAREYSPVRTPLQNVEDSEFREAVERALRELSPRRREVFVLVHLQGLSYREASEITGLRVQTVANYLQKALKDLRIMLAPHLASGQPRESDSDDGAR